MRKKADLPTKLCARCGRPFAWRKRWARDWDRVLYCSERCRRTHSAKIPGDAPKSRRLSSVLGALIWTRSPL